MTNRRTIQNTNQSRSLTFHGLRHTYAAEKYQELVNGGMSGLDAHFAVSRLLGHERADVTNIYLASVRGGNHDGV
jgi:integrase